MVFITAGMGGGTGTGAAPIVAQVAKEMGILTVGVISKPFDFEGVKRLKVAENGAAELESYVDSLIVVLNEKLFEVMGEDAEFDKAFACADDVLHNAVSGIAEIINVQGLINVDFEDVKTVMGEQGKAMMGTATVSGMDRARLAAEAAVASPLLEGVDLSGARGVLVNITANRSLKLSETREVMAAIRGYAADDATVIFGTVYDESLGDALRVTVVATGLNNPQARQNHQPEVVWRQATGTSDAMPTMADLNTFAPTSASAAMSKVGLDSALSASAGMASIGSGATPLMAAPAASSGVDYSQYDLPRVFRSSREASPAPTLGADSSPQAKSMLDKGADYYEIPAFLRKQAD
jgi:cell division protein FtsZ